MKYALVLLFMTVITGPVRARSTPQDQTPAGRPPNFNLLTDPKEENPSAPNVPENLWVRFPIGKVLTEHIGSLRKEPPVRPGSPDPYQPPKASK